MATMPDGIVTTFTLDRNGVKIACEQRELVYCMHCKNASPSVNWRGEVQPDKVKCNYELGGLRKLNDYCSIGERID